MCGTYVLFNKNVDFVITEDLIQYNTDNNISKF